MLGNGKVRCDSCPWYEPNEPANGAGACLYNPPIPVPIPIQSNIARPGAPGLQPGAMGLWPPTQAGRRCHHHPDWHQSLQ